MTDHENRMKAIVQDQYGSPDVLEFGEIDRPVVEESEYVRKAEVDEEVKETRLQGLKDQLAATEGEKAEKLRQEIEDLEAHTEELTEFKSGTSFHTRTGGGTMTK